MPIDFTPDATAIDFTPDKTKIDFMPDSPKESKEARKSRIKSEIDKKSDTSFFDPLTRAAGAIATPLVSEYSPLHAAANPLQVLNLPSEIEMAAGVLPKDAPLPIQANTPLINLPHITPEELTRNASDFLSYPGVRMPPPATPNKAAQIGAGIMNATYDAASGLTTPENLATLPVAEASIGKVAKPVLGLFATQMATQLPSAIKNTYETVNNPDVSLEEKSRAVAQLGLHTLMTVGATKGASDISPNIKVGELPAESTSETPPEPQPAQPPVAPQEPVAVNPEAATAAPSENATNPPVKVADYEGEPLQPVVSAEELNKPAETPTVNESKPAEIAGMGGAIPAEFENSPKTPTGIKNETVDVERQKRGLPAAMQPARKSFGDAWDAAMAKIDRVPEAQDELINSLREKPRALTDEEDALLLHRQIDLQNEFGKATRDLAQAYDDGRMDAVADEKIRVARLSDQLLDLYNIGKQAGTETGRGLNARKMMAYEDFSLAQMEVEKRAANGGKPLTEVQAKEIADLHNKINETQKAYDEYVAKTESRLAELESVKAHNEILKATPRFSPDVIRIAKGIVDKWDKAAEEARQSIQARLGRTSAGIDPTLLLDLAKIGRSHLGHAALDIAEFSAKLVSEFGDLVKPHIQEIYDASKKLIADEEKAQPEKVRKAIKRAKALTDQRAATVEAIKAKVEAGKLNEISPLAQQLARQFVEFGIKDRNELINAVHEILREMDPEITRRQAMDAISGYGQFKQLTRDAVSVQLRDLKGQMQQVGKLEDMEAGKAPSKTGVERRTPSDEERRLIQQVNEAKKKGGFTALDPAKALKSALESVKTRLKNQISDLSEQIATGKKIVREKNPVPGDAETTALKAQRDALKEQYAAIFGEKKLTDEQRLKLATDAVEKSLAEYERRIKERDFSKRNITSFSNPALDALKVRRDAIKEEYQNLRDLSDVAAAERAELEIKRIESEQKSIQKQIDAANEKIKSGDLSPNGSRVNRPAIPELEALKQQRDEVNKQLVEARKKANAKPDSQKEIERIASEQKRLEKAIAEKESKIASGDISTKSTSLNRPDVPELEVLKQKNAELGKWLEEMRKAATPKKTPEEISLQAYKTRLANRTAELQDKLSRGDFSKTPRKTISLDAEALRLKAENERAKNNYKRGLMQDELNNRTKLRRVADIALRINREFVLSRPTSILKLLSYTIQEIGLTPFKEAAGAALSKLPYVREVAKRAPSEVGFSIPSLVDDVVKGFTVGIRDAKDAWKKGGSDLKSAYDPRVHAEGEFKSFFGTLHQMEKAPLMRMVFNRSLKRRLEFAARNGENIADTTVIQKHSMSAYSDALQAALINRNEVVNKVNRFIRSLEEKDKVTGRTSKIGSVAKFLFEQEVPVQHVPANFIARTGDYIIGLVRGGAEVRRAFKRGIESLQPEEANQIMRHLKSGSIGFAFMAVAFMAPQYFGGLFTPVRDKKKTLKPGEIQAGDLTIPHSATHNPMLNAAQFAATMRQVADSKLRVKDKDTIGLTAGAKAAAFGLLDATPYVQELKGYQRLADPRSDSTFFGERIKSHLVPGGVQEVSEFLDKNNQGETVKRKPQSTLDHVKTGIPGLRQEVKQAKK